MTAVVVKDDRIEFQLDGGGFGTFRDDTNTTVTAKPLDKSDYEKQLEKQIANTTDPDKKRQSAAGSRPGTSRGGSVRMPTTGTPPR